MDDLLKYLPYLVTFISGICVAVWLFTKYMEWRCRYDREKSKKSIKETAAQKAIEDR
jgi:hypothetical protein